MRLLHFHFKNPKGTGAKRDVCPSHWVSGAKFPVASAVSAPMLMFTPLHADLKTSACKNGAVITGRWSQSDLFVIQQESVRPRWPYDMRPSARAEKYMCVIVIR